MEETITASCRERKRRGRVNSFRSKGRRDGMGWGRREEDEVRQGDCEGGEGVEGYR